MHQLNYVSLHKNSKRMFTRYNSNRYSCIAIIILMMNLLCVIPTWGDPVPYTDKNGIHYNIENEEATVVYDKNYSEKSQVVIQPTITHESTSYNVTSIAEGAFNNCSSLTSITLPEHLTSVGSDAFSGSGITTLILNCSTINGSWFNDIKSQITSITIGNTVQDINESFYGFPNLTQINVNENNRYNTEGKTLTNTNTSTLIIGCKTTTAIPNYVTKIGNNAFRNTGITSIDLKYVITIGENAFRNTPLTSIVIPSSVTSIGTGAFSYCDNLESISVQENNSHYTSGGGANAIIDKESNILLTGCKNTSNIPDVVTQIGISAFEGCTGLQSIILPQYVSIINDHAFQGCKGLKEIKGGSNGLEVNLPSSISQIGTHAFYDCQALETIIVPAAVTTISNDAFRGCSKLKSVTILGSSLEKIKGQAFMGCSAMEEISFHNTNSFIIGTKAFNDCDNIKKVYCYGPYPTFEDNTNCLNINNIGSYCTLYSTYSQQDYPWNAFYYFVDLANNNANQFDESSKLFYNIIKKYNDDIYVEIINDKEDPNAPQKDVTEEHYYSGIITIPNEIASHPVKSIERRAFYESEITGVTFANNDNAFIIEESAFEKCSSINQEIDLSGIKLSTIGPRAFKGCTSLPSVKLPNTLNVPISIGEEAFMNCEAMTSIQMPAKVDILDNKAFSGCKELSSIIIPDVLTTISQDAFTGCIKLVTVKFGPNDNTTSLTHIDAYAFSGCQLLNNINLPSSLIRIDQKAFSDCRAIEKVEIPSYVSFLGANAFENCFALKTATIRGDSLAGSGLTANTFNACNNLENIVFYYRPESPFSIDNNAFKGCNNIKRVYCMESSGYPTISSNGNPFNISNDEDAKPTLYANNSPTTNEWKCFAPFIYINDANKYDTTSGLHFNIIRPDGGSSYAQIINDKADPVLPKVITDREYNSNKSIPAQVKDGTQYHDVKSIDREAFMESENDTHINISFDGGTNLVKIGSSAFKGCSGITQLSFNSSHLTTIGKEAFFRCSNIETLNLPNSLQVIGESAFEGCSKIKELNLANTALTSIGKAAFYGCSLLGDKLTDAIDSQHGVVTLPNGLTTIGNDAFRSCGRLTTIEIPENVSSLGEQAFMGCGWLSIVTINGKSLNEDGIKARTFQGCTDLEDIIIKYTSTNPFIIDKDAFKNCNKIKRVYCLETNKLDGYPTISSGTDPFNIATNKPILYGYKSRKEVPYWKNFEKFIYLDQANQYDDEYKLFFSIIDLKEKDYNEYAEILNDKADPILDNIIDPKDLASHQYSGDESGKITIPATLGNKPVGTIASKAFYLNTVITEVCFEKNENYGNLNPIISIGESAFEGCTNINKPLDLSDTKLATLGKAAFKGCNNNKFIRVTFPSCLKTVGNEAFSNCTFLDDIEIPQATKNIGEYAFNSCHGLRTLNINSSELTELKANTFNDCRNLETIILKYIQFTIHNEAFNGCNSIKKVYCCASDFPTIISTNAEAVNPFNINNAPKPILYAYVTTKPTQPGWNLFDTFINLNHANKYDNNSHLFFSIVNNSYAEIINDKDDPNGFPKDYSEAHLYYNFPNITIPCTLNIAGTDYPVESIEKNAFKSELNTSIENINFDNATNLKTIGESAFEGCSGITKPIKLHGTQLITIGKAAFKSCNNYKLNEISLPNCLETIGSEAFRECKVEKIVIPENVNDIGESAFKGCNNLKTLTIKGSSLLEIKSSTFSGCSSLEEISFPNVENFHIGKQAFDGCNKIRRVYCQYNSNSNPFPTFDNDDTDKLNGNDIENPDQCTLYAHAENRPNVLPWSLFGHYINIPHHANQFDEASGLFYNIINDLSESYAQIINDKEDLNASLPKIVNEEQEYHGAIIIPAHINSFDVKSIAEKAFYQSSITGIRFEDNNTNFIIEPSSFEESDIEEADLQGIKNLITIGENAFKGCNKLVSAILPNATLTPQSLKTEICEGAFMNCKSLESIQMPDELDENMGLEDNVFNGCEKLISLIMPKGVKTIGNYAFYRCGSLTTIAYKSDDDELESIGNYAFSGCSLFSPEDPFTLPTTLQSIGTYAFNGCKFNKIVILNSVTSLNAFAFNNCMGLESVTINGGNSLNEIVSNTFSKCNKLESITLIYDGNNAFEIKNGAFKDCKNIRKVYCIENSQSNGYPLISDESNPFDISDEVGTVKPTLYAYDDNRSGHWQDDFSLFINLSNINKYDETYKLFFNIIGSGTDKYAQIINDSEDQNGFPKNITNREYAGDIIIPAKVKYEENGDEYEVQSIDYKAFYGKENITSVSLYDNHENTQPFTIGESAFENCTAMQTATFNSTSKVGSIEKAAFKGCSSLEFVNLTNETYGIGDETFMGCSNLETISIPMHVTVINSKTFRNCFKLKNVTLHNNITDIKREAFYGAKKLNNIVLPANLEHIRLQAFYDCQAVEKLEIPHKVETIEREAFMNCRALKSVIIEEKEGISLGKIGTRAFTNCTHLEDITFPKKDNGFIEIEEYAFMGCSQIKKVYWFYSMNSAPNPTYPTITHLDENQEHDVNPFNISGDEDAVRPTLYADRKPDENDPTFWQLFTFVDRTTVNILDEKGGLYYNIIDSEDGKVAMVTNDLPDAIDPNKPSIKAKYNNEEINIPDEIELTVKGETNTYKVYSIERKAFANKENLKKITFGKHIKDIGESAFAGCPLTDIYSNPTKSPTTYANCFDESVYNKATLYIPDDSEDYTDENVWGRFHKGVLTLYELKYIYDNGVEFARQDINGGAPITPIGPPVKEGHKFSGWENVPNYMPNEAHTITGKFEYKLTIKFGDETIKEKDYYYNSEISVFEDIENSKKETGFHIEWSEEKPTKMPANDVTITGRYVPNQYTITYEIDDVVYKTETLEYEREITLPETLEIEEPFSVIWEDYPTTMPNYNITIKGYCQAKLEIDGLVIRINKKENNAEVLPNIDNSSVTEVTIPETVTIEGVSYPITSITEDAFKGYSKLTTITIPKTVSYIGAGAFNDCQLLTEIVLPKAIKTIEKEAFKSCWGLIKVTCLAEEMPTTHADAFKNTNITTITTLFVPESIIDTYKATAPWSGFFKILTIGYTDENTGGTTDGTTDDNTTDDNTTDAINTTMIDGVEIEGYYTIDGRKFNKPQHGLNMVRLKDGRILKRYYKVK